METFDAAPPIIRTQPPNLFILNQYRFDALRTSLFVFDDSISSPPAESTTVDSVTLLNFIQKEWDTGNRTTDRGAEPRRTNGLRYLNTFFFCKQRACNLSTELARGPSIFIADQTFSPWTVVAPQQEKYSEVALPLLRDEPGNAIITIYSDGYRAFLGETELNPMGENTLEFPKAAGRQGRAALEPIIFKPDDHTKYRYIDVFTRDFSVRPGINGGTDIKLTSPITELCEPTLERSYEEMVLRTKCPGKPHLVKFMFYPKWEADVPIRKGSNGFMELTPTTAVTHLKHRAQPIDLVSLIISWGAGLLLFLWTIFKTNA